MKLLNTLVLSLFVYSSLVQAEEANQEVQIYQSLSADNINISGKSGAVTGLQVITSGDSQDISGNQVIIINNSTTCSGMGISAKSNGEGKIRIVAINTGIFEILPFIKIRLQDGSLLSLSEANLLYEIANNNVLEITSQDSQNLNSVILEVKESQSQNFLTIPFYQKVKITQNCFLNSSKHD